jgi:hypothetical protein
MGRFLSDTTVDGVSRKASSDIRGAAECGANQTEAAPHYRQNRRQSFLSLNLPQTLHDMFDARRSHPIEVLPRMSTASGFQITFMQNSG